MELLWHGKSAKKKDARIRFVCSISRVRKEIQQTLEGKLRENSMKMLGKISPRTTTLSETNTKAKHQFDRKKAG